jgi:YVTN family beta-propeller protein
MRTSFLFLFSLAACESFHSGSFMQQDAAPPDIDGQNADAHIPVPRALATSGDFGSPGVGVLSKLEVTDLGMTTNVTPGSALGDPVLRQIGNRVYVINRYGSNAITILDAKTLGLVEQISTGTNTNPQDVAVVGTKLYVPARDTAGVLVLTPGSSSITTIDLATPLGDSDGMPDCVSAYAVGNYVYVACDMQTQFANILDSKVAVIDATSNAVVGSVVTPHKNPLGFFTRAPTGAPYNGDLLIPLGPNLFGDLTEGCVARISTTSPTTPTASCGVTNATLGGFPNGLAVDAVHNKLYVAVVEDFGSTNPNAPRPPRNKLRSYDLASQTIAATPLSAADQQIVDVAVCPGGDIVATDQKTNAGGLRVWRNGTERTTSAMSIGRPPTTSALVCYDP